MTGCCLAAGGARPVGELACAAVPASLASRATAQVQQGLPAIAFTDHTHFAVFLLLPPVSSVTRGWGAQRSCCTAAAARLATNVAPPDVAGSSASSGGTAEANAEAQARCFPMPIRAFCPLRSVYLEPPSENALPAARCGEPAIVNLQLPPPSARSVYTMVGSSNCTMLSPSLLLHRLVSCCRDIALLCHVSVRLPRHALCPDLHTQQHNECRLCSALATDCRFSLSQPTPTLLSPSFSPHSLALL